MEWLIGGGLLLGGVGLVGWALEEVFEENAEEAREKQRKAMKRVERAMREEQRRVERHAAQHRQLEQERFGEQLRKLLGGEEEA